MAFFFVRAGNPTCLQDAFHFQQAKLGETYEYRTGTPDFSCSAAKMETGELSDPKIAFLIEDLIRTMDRIEANGGQEPCKNRA